MTARPPPFIFRGQFTYAPTLRPAGFATVPAGFTEFGPPTDDYPHGTVYGDTSVVLMEAHL